MSEVHATIQRAANLFQAGQRDEAVALMEGLVARSPEDGEARYNLASVLMLVGRCAEAKQHAQECARLLPDSAEACGLCAQACIALDDRTGAEHAARRAAELEPGNVDRLRGLAWVLHRVGRFAEAARWAERGLASAPGDADLWLKRAVAIQCMGRTDEAFEVYRRGSAACPDSIDLAEGFANCTTYHATLEPAQTLAAHKRFGALVERAAIGARPPAVDRDAGVKRPLRVGLLSADLRAHSVANFARPLLERCDAARIELHVFHYGQAEDGVSARLRGFLAEGRWHHALHATAEEINAAIRSAKVDVLVELAGLTRGHHLRTVAMRPAPLMATYMGYANTTGMRVVDVRIVDSLTDPARGRSGTPPLAAGAARMPGAGGGGGGGGAAGMGAGGSIDADALATERLVRIDPCFLCYTPPEDAPDVSPGPRETGDGGEGSVVFGSFNVITKVNDRTLALWKRVLDAVPGSRLVVKSRGLEDEGVRDDVARRMHAAGMDASRIELVGKIESRAGHLEAYSRVDIALDPWPYHGTTTTCEALLMGVPVVSLAGWTHAARVGVSLLTNAGLPELIAQSEDAYVRIAADLAGDAERLRTLRTTLRPRLLASPVCDAGAFAARFYEAVERAWDGKCGRRRGQR